MLARLLIALLAVPVFWGCSQTPISPSWAELSFDVDSPGTTSTERWSGFVDYGTPVQLDEHTVALIERRLGLEFALWHLNIAEGTLHFIATLNEGVTTPSGFDDVVFHHDGPDTFAEFILITTAQTAPNRFTGNSIIGEINLRTGATKVKKDKVKHVASEEIAHEKLLDKRRSGKTVTAPKPLQVKNVVAQALAKHGMSFDYKRGRFVLTTENRLKLKQAVRDLDKAGSDKPAKFLGLQRLLNDLPSCPATRELARQVSSAAGSVE
jgi:hypothetical protein